MRYLSILFFLLSAIFCPPLFSASEQAAKMLSFPDVDEHFITLNAQGHYTLVLYANPDMEQDLRQVITALEPYRTNHNLFFIRVVDFRGGIPPTARGAVRLQIRKELDKENAHLQSALLKAGIKNVTHQFAPIMPDFNGDILNALGWSNIEENVKFVLYDHKGTEIKRDDAGKDGKKLTLALDNIL